MSNQEEVIDVHLPFSDRNVVEGVMYEIYQCKYNYTGIVYPVYMCLKYLGVDTTEFLNRELQKLDAFRTYQDEGFGYKNKFASDIPGVKNLIKNIFVEELGFPSNIEIPINIQTFNIGLKYTEYRIDNIKWLDEYPYTNWLLIELANRLIATHLS